MKPLTVILLVFLLVQPLLAANYSFTSNAAQEALIALARADYNQVNGTSFTNLQYIRFVLRDKLSEWEAKFEDVENESLRERYRNADDTTKAEIKTLLGM